MAETTNASKRDELLQVIKKTPAQDIAELQFVKDRFIKNYNACNKKKDGDMMYHRQLVYFKQLVSADDKLSKVDPFTLYACFITAGVKGYSFDPEDKEVYLLALDGKACLWRQAGAHVRRLIQTNQIKSADQAKLVYQGDIIEVENGRVVKHVEKFQSDDIILGYIRFELDDQKNDRFFIYRKSDWLAWKKKSKQANGPNWNADGKGTPDPGFLRTKIVKHACQEKCWAIGTSPAIPELVGVSVEIDDVEDMNASDEAGKMLSGANGKQPEGPKAKPNAIQDIEPVDDDFNAGANNNKKTIQVEDDTF